MTLTWDPPTENTNGTLLTNLVGYTIYYGTKPQDYSSSIVITNPGLTAYDVENLSPGTYYFVITANNSDGESSAYSAQVSAVVQ